MMETVRSQELEATARPRAGEALRCFECGAANKPGAEWCGQCFARFETGPEPAVADDPSPEPLIHEADEAQLRQAAGEARSTLSELAGGPPKRPRKAPPPPPGAPARKGGSTSAGTKTDPGAFNIDGDEITWTCSRCDSENEFESNVCSICGSTFASAIKPPEDPRTPKDANMAAMISLFLPGAGHAYIGMWGQAVARAVISLWVVTVTIFAAAQGAPQAKIMAVLFGLTATGLWVVAAHDAFREASAMSKLVILKQRMFLYLVLGLLMLSIVMVFSTAMGASG